MFFKVQLEITQKNLSYIDVAVQRLKQKHGQIFVEDPSFETVVRFILSITQMRLQPKPELYRNPDETKEFGFDLPPVLETSKKFKDTSHVFSEGSGKVGLKKFYYALKDLENIINYHRDDLVIKIEPKRITLAGVKHEIIPNPVQLSITFENTAFFEFVKMSIIKDYIHTMANNRRRLERKVFHPLFMTFEIQDIPNDRLVDIPDKVEEFINRYIDDFRDPSTFEFEIDPDSNTAFVKFDEEYLSHLFKQTQEIKELTNLWGIYEIQLHSFV